MLDVKRLRILREVARQGSFSAAADELYLSQSAVSQQVATLEKEVGMTLLERTREGPQLTEAGRVLVNHANAAIARLESLGYLSSTPAAEDRRKRELVLTERGAEAMASTSVLDRERVRTLLAGLPSADRAAAVRGLSLLAKAARGMRVTEER